MNTRGGGAKGSIIVETESIVVVGLGDRSDEMYCWRGAETTSIALRSLLRIAPRRSAPRVTPLLTCFLCAPHVIAPRIIAPLAFAFLTETPHCSCSLLISPTILSINRYDAEPDYGDNGHVNSGWGNCHDPAIGGEGAEAKRCYKAWLNDNQTTWDWR